MKRILLILFGASALAFSACKQSTPDANNTIDDGMNTSETAIGSGTTRPEDQSANNNNDPATAQSKPSGIDDGTDTTNTEMGKDRIETTKLPRQNNEPNANVPK